MIDFGTFGFTVEVHGYRHHRQWLVHAQVVICEYFFQVEFLNALIQQVFSVIPAMHYAILHRWIVYYQRSDHDKQGHDKLKIFTAGLLPFDFSLHCQF